MRICEFAGDAPAGDPAQLLALTTFLKDRSEDENARAQISQTAFIDLAQSLGVNVTTANLADMIAQPPLSNVLEPVDPNSGVLRFKGNTEVATGMSVDQARAVVDSNAKAALNRRR
jgi:hypothetical protein